MIFFLRLLLFFPIVLPHLYKVVAAPSADFDEHHQVIDLGYAKHIPTFVNETKSGRKISIYKNIRFANSPIGNLRFRRPDTEMPRTDGIQDGNAPWASTDCIASAPASAPFPGINGTTWGHEDCLFLDVYVPEDVKPGDKVPVLHNLFGSAYAFGSKEMWSSPMGLFDLKTKHGSFIYVANNYRLGMPGWTSVPDLDMDANVGMHDCLAATEWTSKYINRFGGDRNQVTVIGQSAGAGIIQLLTVLNGGQGKKLPFQQAFASSPGLPPRKNATKRQHNMFNSILEAANCTSLECLRSVPEETMRKVNDIMINQTPSDAGGGVFGPAPGFGPVPDGKYIPDIPETLFRDGRYHKELKGLIVGNMALEGKGTSHDTGLPEYFPTMVRQILQNASSDTVTEIQSQYHWGSNPAKLAWDWTTDILFACNAYNFARAFPFRAYRYIMSIPPATHGFDLFFYFYVDQDLTPVPDPTLAYEFQRRLLQFVHGKEIPWHKYTEQETITNITDTGFNAAKLSEDLKDRCEMINKVVLDPRNGV
ncbi:Fc.00g058270.m01.CDS01 [Cosmosporella sp. VM-42]